MSDTPTTTEQRLVQFKIDGKEFEAPAGTTIIQAAHAAGIEVPFFCYHPGLTPEGNCRMCLVEVVKGRKPVASCVTPVEEGMEVITNSPAAKEARKGVLELMLVNHPLDCPICDKSGECELQDNTYNHGPDNSRMVELKELKPTKDLGSNIALWGNRCIVCTRCVRFCDEVSGTGELSIVNRADHSVVDVFDEYPLENPLSMNTVDICPVGALISKDFLYESRVWYLNKTKSICTGCARGCNISVESVRNEIKRLMPRHNDDVNGYWMCDYGRFDFGYVGDGRLYRYHLVGSSSGEEDPQVSSNPADAAGVIADRLRSTVEAHGADSIAGVGSAFMTLEELFLFRKIFESLGSTALGALSRPDANPESFPQFAISGDKNPNRAGVKAVLGDGALGADLDTIKSGVEKGTIRALVVVADLPNTPLDEEWARLLGSLDVAFVLSLTAPESLSKSVSILPASAFAEKNGTMINEDGRLQRLRTAVEPPRSVRLELELFQAVLGKLGQWERVVSADGVFRQLGEIVPALAGKTHRDVGELGMSLNGGGNV